LCRSCHDYVTEHPPEAEAIGAVAHSWNPPHVDATS
jgi:hypothetical protein